jgi:hypothetical protein
MKLAEEETSKSAEYFDSDSQDEDEKHRTYFADITPVDRLRNDGIVASLELIRYFVKTRARDMLKLNLPDATILLRQWSDLLQQMAEANSMDELGEVKMEVAQDCHEDEMISDAGIVR